ncbi:MAG: hypothetical protein RLZZ396_694 [Planctomycetota bacterium]
MARKSFRFAREINDLLQALDDHMVILRAAVLRSLEEPSFIKTVASELRVLVCYSSGTEGLLWRICETMQISDLVDVVDPGEIDPDHPLSNGLELQFSPIRRNSEIEPGETVSLKEIIKTSRAIFVASIKSERITHENLIRLVSEQIGGAHEDEKVSPELEKLRSFLLNGRYLFNNVLLTDAELVLQVAERVIRNAEKTIHYKRRIISKESGDITIAVKTNHHGYLLGNLNLFTISCEVNELVFSVTGSPAGLKIRIFQYGSQVEELSIAVDEIPTVVSFAISYSSRVGKIRVHDGCKEIVRSTCNLGWLDTGFFSEPKFESITGDFISIESVLLYQRLLSPAEIAQLKDISAVTINEQIQNHRHFVDFPE